MPKSPSINVLFMASEADPLIKVGGLGDVAGSLPRALRALNQSIEQPVNLDVRLVIPFHPAIRLGNLSPQLLAEYPVTALDGVITARVYTVEMHGLPVYLIGGDPIDTETAVYSLDLKADGYKYVFFSVAALALAHQLNWPLDILHANDWHTASAVYALALQRSVNHGLIQTKSVLTVHNLPYLGAMTTAALESFGLPAADHSDLPPWGQQMALPLGLLTADSIVAVSPGYAKEILTEDLGSGLHTFLKNHQEKLSGILNGLDTSRWDPSKDVEILANYSKENPVPRPENKSSLQAELRLEQNPNIPVLAMVTRMDPQKGVDLAVDALRFLLQQPGSFDDRFQVIFLGTGDPRLETAVLQLETDYPERIRARIIYNEALSRRIYAGADMLLMPSRYEPCGLSQMIAMRYGCVPVARLTGGLSDTILDAASSNYGTGFLYSAAEPEGLVEVIRRALMVFTDYPPEWQKIQLHGMQQDFSWDRSAQEYLQLYRSLSGK